MKYALLDENNKVIQTQPNAQEGFVEVTDDIVCGMKKSGKKFVAPAPDPKTWDEIRGQRSALLSACDWTVLSDAPLTASEKTAWINYRQSLRDIPETFATPDEVIWPEQPQ